MKFIYPAVIAKIDENHYEGHFPDLEDCYSSGETLMDAVEKAREAATDWITVELDDPDGKLPPVSDESDITLKENEVIRNVLVNIRFMEGWDE